MFTMTTIPYFLSIVLRFFGLMMSPSTEGLTTITAQFWGSVDGQNVTKYTLKNNNGQEVDVISYGATITAIRTPDKHGNIADVVLGFDNIEGYLSKENPYFGATVGRVANRIAKGKFTLDNVEYQISKNAGDYTLHGGFKGWNAKVWNASIENNRVVMTLLSEDGDEGFPGAVIASVTFCLLSDGTLSIEMKAFATKATPVNLVNHSYFNLAGHNTNAKELYEHHVTMNADRWTVTINGIPTGEVRPVENSVMDMRKGVVLGHVFKVLPAGGFDDNFCLPGENDPKKMKFVSKVVHPVTGRYLEVHSNQPGVQFYTSNGFPEVGNKGIVGKNGSEYFKHAALCLETQNYPDAVNHENFPNSILRPSQTYHHVVGYKFGVQQ